MFPSLQLPNLQPILLRKLNIVDRQDLNHAPPHPQMQNPTPHFSKMNTETNSETSPFQTHLTVPFEIIQNLLQPTALYYWKLPNQDFPIAFLYTPPTFNPDSIIYPKPI